jgi:MOSC domain-containing protein YiiM
VAGRILTLNVGRAGTIPWRGRQVRTGIFKDPVDGPVALGEEGLDGDEQADLRVHGGPDKAVCCYASEHLPRLEALIEQELPPGAFGENLRLEGMVDDEVLIGDVYAVGDAVVQVSQPRGPCFKLSARWRSRKLPAMLAREGISGWYFRVLRTGSVTAGDALELTEREGIVSVADVMHVTYGDARDDTKLLRRVLAAPALAETWRRHLEHDLVR